MTNYERIKTATIEEIERLLYNVYLEGFIHESETQHSACEA